MTNYLETQQDASSMNLPDLDVYQNLDIEPNKEYFDEVLLLLKNTNEDNIAVLANYRIIVEINQAQDKDQAKQYLLESLIADSDARRVIEKFNKNSKIPNSPLKQTYLSLYFVALGLSFPDISTGFFNEDQFQANVVVYDEQIKDYIVANGVFPVNNQLVGIGGGILSDDLNNVTGVAILGSENVVKNARDAVADDLADMTYGDDYYLRKLEDIVNSDLNQLSQSQIGDLNKMLDDMLDAKKQAMMRSFEQIDAVDDAMMVGQDVNADYMKGFANVDLYKEWMEDFDLTELEIKAIQKWGQAVLGDGNLVLDGQINTGDTRNYLGMMILGTRDGGTDLFSLDTNDLGVIMDDGFEGLSLDKQNTVMELFWPVYLRVMGSGRYMETQVKDELSAFWSDCVELAKTTNIDVNNQNSDAWSLYIKAQNEMMKVLYGQQRENYTARKLNEVKNMDLDLTSVRNSSYRDVKVCVLDIQGQQFSVPDFFGSWRNLNYFADIVNDPNQTTEEIIKTLDNTAGLKKIQNNLLVWGKENLNGKLPISGENYDQMKKNFMKKHYNKPGSRGKTLVANPVLQEWVDYELTVYCIQHYNAYLQESFQQILGQNKISLDDYNSFLKTYATNVNGRMSEFVRVNSSVADINELQDFLSEDFLEVVSLFDQGMNQVLGVIFPDLEGQELGLEVQKMNAVQNKVDLFYLDLLNKYELTEAEYQAYNSFLAMLTTGVDQTIDDADLESAMQKMGNMGSEYENYLMGLDQTVREYLVKSQQYKEGVMKLYAELSAKALPWIENNSADWDQKLFKGMGVLGKYNDFVKSNRLPNEDKFLAVQQELSDSGLDYFMMGGQILGNYFGIDPRFAGDYKKIQDVFQAGVDYEQKKIDFYDGLSQNNIPGFAGKVVSTAGGVLGETISLGLGVIYGFGDATIGLGGRLGYRAQSLFADEYKMVALNDHLNSFLNSYKGREDPRVYNGILTGDKVNIFTGAGINQNALFYQLGSTYSNMKVLLEGAQGLQKFNMKVFGGSKMGAYRAGLVQMGTVVTAPQFYLDGLNSGLTKGQASSYALFQGLLTGSLELISPNEFVVGLGGNSPIMQQIVKEMFQEILQEEIQEISGVLVNQFVNNQYSVFLNDKFTMEDFAITAILTALTTGMVVGESHLQHNQQAQQQWQNELDNLPEPLLKKMLSGLQNSSPDFHNTVIAKIDEMVEQIDNLGYMDQNMQNMRTYLLFLKQGLENGTPLDNFSQNNTTQDVVDVNNNSVETVNPSEFVDKLLAGEEIYLELGADHRTYLTSIFSEILASPRLSKWDQVKIVDVLEELGKNAAKYVSPNATQKPYGIIKLDGDMVSVKFTNQVDETYTTVDKKVANTIDGLKDRVNAVNNMNPKDIKQLYNKILLGEQSPGTLHWNTGAGLGFLEVAMRVQSSYTKYGMDLSDFNLSLDYDENAGFPKAVTIGVQLPISLDQNQMYPQVQEALDYIQELKNLPENVDRGDYFDALTELISKKQFRGWNNSWSLKEIIENSELARADRERKILLQNGAGGMNLNQTEFDVLWHIHTQIGGSMLFGLNYSDIRAKYEYFQNNMPGYPRPDLTYSDLTDDQKTLRDKYDVFFRKMVEGGFLANNLNFGKMKGYTIMLDSRLKNVNFDLAASRQLLNNSDGNYYLCLNFNTFMEDSYWYGDGFYLESGDDLFYTKLRGKPASLLLNDKNNIDIVLIDFVYQYLGDLFVDEYKGNTNISPNDLYNNMVAKYPAIPNFVDRVEFVYTDGNSVPFVKLVANPAASVNYSSQLLNPVNANATGGFVSIDFWLGKDPSAMANFKGFSNKIYQGVLYDQILESQSLLLVDFYLMKNKELEDLSDYQRLWFAALLLPGRKFGDFVSSTTNEVSWLGKQILNANSVLGDMNSDPLVLETKLANLADFTDEEKKLLINNNVCGERRMTKEALLDDIENFDVKYELLTGLEQLRWLNFMLEESFKFQDNDLSQKIYMKIYDMSGSIAWTSVEMPAYVDMLDKLSTVVNGSVFVDGMNGIEGLNLVVEDDAVYRSLFMMVNSLLGGKISNIVVSAFDFENDFGAPDFAAKKFDPNISDADFVADFGEDVSWLADNTDLMGVDDGYMELPYGEFNISFEGADGRKIDIRMLHLSDVPTLQIYSFHISNDEVVYLDDDVDQIDGEIGFVREVWDAVNDFNDMHRNGIEPDENYLTDLDLEIIFRSIGLSGVDPDFVDFDTGYNDDRVIFIYDGKQYHIPRSAVKSYMVEAAFYTDLDDKESVWFDVLNEGIEIETYSYDQSIEEELGWGPQEQIILQKAILTLNEPGLWYNEEKAQRIIDAHFWGQKIWIDGVWQYSEKDIRLKAGILAGRYVLSDDGYLLPSVDRYGVELDQNGDPIVVIKNGSSHNDVITERERRLLLENNVCGDGPFNSDFFDDTDFDYFEEISDGFLFPGIADKIRNWTTPNGKQFTVEDLLGLFGGVQLFEDIFGSGAKIKFVGSTMNKDQYFFEIISTNGSSMKLSLNMNGNSVSRVEFSGIKLLDLNRGLGTQLTINQLSYMANLGLKAYGYAAKTGDFYDGKIFSGYYSWMTMGFAMQFTTSNIESLEKLKENFVAGEMFLALNSDGSLFNFKNKADYWQNKKSYGKFMISQGGTETISLNGVDYTSGQIYDKVQAVLDGKTVGNLLSDPFWQTDLGKQIWFYNGFGYDFVVDPKEVLDFNVAKSIISPESLDIISGLKMPDGQTMTINNVVDMFGGPDLIKQVFGDGVEISLVSENGYYGLLLKKDGVQKSLLSLNIVDDKLSVVSLEKTEIPDVLHGQGWGRTLRLKQMQNFVDMGIETVVGLAGKTNQSDNIPYNGYYSWMQMGFKPIENDENTDEFFDFYQRLSMGEFKIFLDNGNLLSKQQKIALKGNTYDNGSYGLFQIVENGNETIEVGGVEYTSGEIYQKMLDLTTKSLDECFADPFWQTSLGKEIWLYNGFEYYFSENPQDIVDFNENN